MVSWISEKLAEYQSFNAYWWELSWFRLHFLVEEPLNDVFDFHKEVICKSTISQMATYLCHCLLKPSWWHMQRHWQTMLQGLLHRRDWPRFLDLFLWAQKESEVAEHIHLKVCGHHLNYEKTCILDSDQNWFQRGIRETIYIRAQKPNLNRNTGRYTIPVVWDTIISLHAGNQPAMQAPQS